MNHELHPLCTLFPRMGENEFQALVDDIQINGLRQPIVLHDGMILDGGNRYRACIEADIEPTFVEFDGSNLVSFVLSANLHRRHMTAGQQAAIVASAQDWALAQQRGGDRGNQHRTAKVAETTLATVQDRASAAGVHRTTQISADKVVKADRELGAKVARGEMTLPDAVEQITGKRPGAKRPSKPQSPAPQTLAASEDEDLADAMGADPVELLSDLQRENEALLAQIKTLTAEDTKAELHKMILQRDHAVREQEVAMDRAHKEQRLHAQKHRALMRCGKAVGEDDPTKIAATVEAFVRAHGGMPFKVVA